MGFEAIALVDIDKARIGKEHHLVAELLDRLADADRIERRPEGGFGKECDRLLRHGLPPDHSIHEDARVCRRPADLDSVADPERAAVGGVGGDADEEGFVG